MRGCQPSLHHRGGFLSVADMRALEFQEASRSKVLQPTGRSQRDSPRTAVHRFMRWLALVICKISILTSVITGISKTFGKFFKSSRKNGTIPHGLIQVGNISRLSGVDWWFPTLVEQLMLLLQSVLFPPVSCKNPWYGQRCFTLQADLVKHFTTQFLVNPLKTQISPLFSKSLSGAPEILEQAWGWRRKAPPRDIFWFFRIPKV